MLRILTIATTITALLLGCSPSKEKQQAEATEPMSVENPLSEVAPEKEIDFYEVLQEIPKDLIDIPWQSSNQYFSHILKVLRLNYDGIESFRKTNDFFSFGGVVYNENEELEEGYYSVNRLKLWTSKNMVVVGWSKAKEHESLASSETLNAPVFFVRKDSIWRKYPIETIFPVAFASDCFFSPLDDRILVSTEDDRGQEAEYVLAWQDGRFVIDKSNSPFIAYDFQKEAEEEFFKSSKLTNQQISKLNAHFSKGTLLNPSLNLLFPNDYNRFLENKIYNEEPKDKIEIKPIDRQSYPGDINLYVFSMDYGQETASGKIVFFRTMKNGKWVSEVTQFDGSYAGAVPERIELDYTFVHNGFNMIVRDDIYFMAFPDLWVGKIGIPWEIKAANNVETTFVRLEEDGKLDKVGYEKRKTFKPEIAPSLEMEKSLIATKKKALNTYREQLYQLEEEGNIYVLSPEEQLAGEKQLRKMYLQAVGNLPSKPARFNLAYQSMVDGLAGIITNDKKPEVKSLDQGVSYYEGRLEYDNTPYTIIFNNISIPEFNLSGKFEDLYEALAKQFKLNFYLFPGRFEKVPDITSSGTDNYLLTFQGGYNTTVEKSFELFRFDSLGVFGPTNAAFWTAFEGGLCHAPIGTDLSVEISDNKLILTREVGKDDRQAGEIEYNCTSKFYQETYTWDDKAKVFRRFSFQEIEKPNTI